ncbi:MAG: Hsp33 family molecular chaperone HslO [Tissierellia bacterium]|nr:Hsp33 family molecular chaperone HslO [Tissierellia bacterium]
MKDYIVRAIDETKSVRLFIARTTGIVQEIRNIHESSATGSAALGRLATMASLMGINLKSENDTVTLKMDGNGIGGKLIAVADYKGDVRVTATNPQADCPPNDKGKLDVAKFVGTDGQIAIIRDYGLKEPYSGLSRIVTGEIAEDFANYYFYSEQTPTVISLGVLVDTDLSIRAAGGIFIQLMPDASEEVISILEEIIKDLPAISSLIDQKLSPEEILDKYFYKLKPEIISTADVSYKCNCSREKIEKAMISIGKEDLQKIIDEDGKAQVVCDFCKKEYNFTKEDLEGLMDQILSKDEAGSEME